MNRERTKVVMVAGKGGVGKTTVAAATGLEAARRGKRALVMSFDLAHSLSDSFDRDVALFDQNEGRPLTVAENLDIQEIDVSAELVRHWSDIYQYFAAMFMAEGVSAMAAEDAAILPGMEDVISLLFLKRYLDEGTYDLIVLDCPPTTESLRFVNITASLHWYISHRLKLDRSLLKLIRPLVGKRASGLGIPQDSYFDAITSLIGGLEGMDGVLKDHSQTAVRLVCNAEKMVIRETKRAFLYFNLYGVITDTVVMNRVLPEDTEGYLSGWARQQADYRREVEEFFKPVPVVTIPMFPREVVGQEALAEVGRILFSDERRPVTFTVHDPPFAFEKRDSAYELSLTLPAVEKGEVDLARSEDNLVVRIGSFKRFIPLPSSILATRETRAELKEGKLLVRFQ